MRFFQFLKFMDDANYYLAFDWLTKQGGGVSKLSDVDGDPKLMGTGKGLKAILGGLEELWDQSQYTEEYNLSQFLAKLNSWTRLLGCTYCIYDQV